MKTVYTVRANHKMVAPGVWENEAEAMVTGPDVAEEVYVNVSKYDGMTSLTVSDTSVMDQYESGAPMTEEEDAEFMEKIQRWKNGEDVDFGPASDDTSIEHYGSLSAAKGSKYYGVFKMLNGLLNAMAKETVEE